MDDEGLIGSLVTSRIEDFEVDLWMGVGSDFTVGSKDAVFVSLAFNRVKLFVKESFQSGLFYFFDQLLILVLKLIHDSILTGTRNTIVMLKVSHLLSQFFKSFILIFMAFNSVLPGVRRQKELPNSVQKPASVSVVFLVVGVGCVVASPVKSAVVVPNWEDIFFSDSDGFFLLTKNFSHESQEVFSGVSVDSDDFVAFLGRKLFHDGLDNAERILIKLLEIVPEIPHDMRTVQDSFQELILASHVVNVSLFGRA